MKPDLHHSDAPSMFPGSPADGRATLCSGPSLIFLVNWCHQVESLPYFLLEPSLKPWFQQKIDRFRSTSYIRLDTYNHMYIYIHTYIYIQVDRISWKPIGSNFTFWMVCRCVRYWKGLYLRCYASLSGCISSL